MAVTTKSVFLSNKAKHPSTSSFFLNGAVVGKDKNFSKKVDISEITIPLSLLNNNIKFINDAIINDIDCKIIEVENGDEKIKLWIDLEDFLIHKKEHYDKKLKLYKSIDYNNLIIQDEIKFYKKMIITHHKEKEKSEFTINHFQIMKFDDISIFLAPKGERK